VQINQWDGYLPENAIVMAKRRSTKETVVQLGEPAVTDGISLEEALQQNYKFKIEGDSASRLVFIGDAPDTTQGPQSSGFFGKSGPLLDKMIEAMGFKKSEVCICRISLPSEKQNAPGENIAPSRVFVALGKASATSLLQSETRWEDLRGAFHDYRGSKLLATFHPLELLSNPALKKEAWADLQKVLKELGMGLPPKKA
jgi:uracil-DNA glycosylase family 4